MSPGKCRYYRYFEPIVGVCISQFFSGAQRGTKRKTGKRRSCNKNPPNFRAQYRVFLRVAVICTLYFCAVFVIDVMGERSVYDTDGRNVWGVPDMPGVLIARTSILIKSSGFPFFSEFAWWLVFSFISPIFATSQRRRLILDIFRVTNHFSLSCPSHKVRR